MPTSLVAKEGTADDSDVSVVPLVVLPTSLIAYDGTADDTVCVLDTPITSSIPENVIIKNARLINDIANHFQNLFPPSSRWESFEVLQDCVKVAAKSMDFTVTSSNLRLLCNRCGSPRNNYDNGMSLGKRKRINILKCGCDFVIVASYVVPKFKDPNNLFGPPHRYLADRYTPELKEV